MEFSDETTWNPGSTRSRSTIPNTRRRKKSRSNPLTVRVKKPLKTKAQRPQGARVEGQLRGRAGNHLRAKTRNRTTAMRRRRLSDPNSGLQDYDRQCFLRPFKY